MNKEESKGSVWRIWDLQVQTILDDGYIELEHYYKGLIKEDEEKWIHFISKVGGEVNALKYDSKKYFNDITIPERERCNNYARTLFSFIEVYKPELGLIGFTDHNYYNNSLLDELYNYSKTATCKCICGVEINACGVHILIFFDKPPFQKNTFSEGIRSFLDTIHVTTQKKNGVLMVSDMSVKDVIEAGVLSQNGVYIFPHCNSSNGLFQERGKTDRTHLADIFNYKSNILLQCNSLDNVLKTTDFINKRNDNLTAKSIFSIASDSRKLLDIGRSDNEHNFFWVKANTNFLGLKQILIEPNRVFIGKEPDLLKRVRENRTKFIKSLTINRLPDAAFEDIWFDNFYLELNSGLVAIIGNKGGGKSAIADIISVCANTLQNKEHFSFLNSNKFRKVKPYNFSEKFNAKLTWHDGQPMEKRLDHNPDKALGERVKYIPQNFLEKLCATVDIEAFENELKQIIFSHTPSEKRFGKFTLDELINYKSDLILNRLNTLKNEISRLNNQIIHLESKSTQEYKRKIESSVQQKKNEIISHDKNIPLIPSTTHQAEQSNTNKQIDFIRKQIQSIENEISEFTNELNVLSYKNEELRKSLFYFTSLNDDLKKQLDDTNEYATILSKFKIDIDNVFRFSIDVTLIEQEIVMTVKNIKLIEHELNEKNNGSKAFLLQNLKHDLQNNLDKLDRPAREYQKYLNDARAWQEKNKSLIGDIHIEGSLKSYEGQLDYINNRLNKDLEDKYNERELLIERLFEEKEQLLQVRRELFLPATKYIEEFKELKERYDVKLDVTFELKSFVNSFVNYINHSKSGSFSGREESQRKLHDIIEKSDFKTKAGFIKFSQDILKNLRFDQRNSSNIPNDIGNQLRKEYSISDLYDFLFHFEYLQPVYSLKLGNKTLLELSPGERGALLLIFYLVLDNDDIPLIIDQPEENLDNESIYHILVYFIKKIKEKRQIIIVTHNPNLAIVCDADQIVHMQIDKANLNKVNFYSGAIEDEKINKTVVDILEGTFPAFNNRVSKYIKSNN